MTLLALTLIVWSGTSVPRLVVETPSRQHAREVSPSAPRLTPRQNEWLEHAVEQILRGE